MTEVQLLSTLNSKWKDVKPADQAAFTAHVVGVLSLKPYAQLTRIEQRAITAHGQRTRRDEVQAGAAERRTVQSMKIAEASGCLSVYGLLQSMPVSLHPDQWLILLGQSEAIKAFIANPENAAKMKLISDAVKAAKEAKRAAK